MRGHGYRIFETRADWWLLLIFIVLYPFIALIWVTNQIWYGLVHGMGIVFGVVDGKSLREAHDECMDDIESMKNGAKYGGY